MERNELCKIIADMTNNNTLCLESALDYNGLGNVIDRKPQFLTNHEDKDWITFTEFQCKNGFDDLIEDESTGLKYTNAERTLCDMIIYDRDEGTLMDALDDYLVEHNDDDSILMEYAEKYGVKEKMSQLIKELPDYLSY